MTSGAVQRWAHFVSRAPGLRDSGLACLGAGEQQGWLPSTRRRTLSSHALVIVSAGTGRFQCPTLDTRVVAPAWFWLFPGVWHEYGPDGGSWTEHWVLFEGVATRGYAAYGTWNQQRPLHAGELPPGELTACFAGLRTATTSPGRYGQLVAAALVHRLIGATAVAREPPQPRSAVQALLEGAAEDLSVVERAMRIGISPARLRTEIRDATGLTPHEFVLRTRLSRAQELLAASDLTVGDVATHVGYDDPAYFSRLFARRVGLSPTRFRQQQRRH